MAILPALIPIAFLVGLGLVLGDGFNPVANVEFLTGILHKVSYRSHLDIHFVSDLLVNESRTKQVEHLLLPWR